MTEVILGIDSEKLTKAIGKIGYDIIDYAICPGCGLEENAVGFAALYLVNINEYAYGAVDNKCEDELKRIGREILGRIEHRYGLEKDELYCFDGQTPIALLACYILENGNPDSINAVIKE